MEATPKKERMLNLDWGVLPSADGLGMPLILKEEKEAPEYLVPYRQRFRTDEEVAGGCVHFFLDDYRFEACWSRPASVFPYLAKLGWALTPDFSLYPGMPLALQLYNVYRNRWCGAVWQQAGLDVIPTVSWSNPDSFSFCFLGIEEGSAVAISTVGLGGREVSEPERRMFELGYETMVETIEPSLVIVYGETEELFWELSGEAKAVPRRHYPSRWKSIRAERKRIQGEKVLDVT